MLFSLLLLCDVGGRAMWDKCGVSTVLYETYLRSTLVLAMGAEAQREKDEGKGGRVSHVR